MTYPEGVEVLRTAVVSGDGKYRYRLIRRWDRGPILPFVMLNPSTADAEQDDPTIRRIVGFARRLGYDGIGVWNLYAYRATDPRALRTTEEDIVGPENDRRLRNLLQWAQACYQPVIAGWGLHAPDERVATVLSWPGAGALHTLGVTTCGAPKHPLARGKHRIPDDAIPVRWRP